MEYFRNIPQILWCYVGIDPSRMRFSRLTFQQLWLRRGTSQNKSFMFQILSRKIVFPMLNFSNGYFFQISIFPKGLFFPKIRFTKDLFLNNLEILYIFSYKRHINFICKNKNKIHNKIQQIQNTSKNNIIYEWIIYFKLNIAVIAFKVCQSIVCLSISVIFLDDCKYSFFYYSPILVEPITRTRTHYSNIIYMTKIEYSL